ncbi:MULTISPECIES: FMN-dependent NADH-azoreductase [Thermomonospora]|uniref:FMN dependent NADH:quinone oxidoreductase n=1 Tax=Thermomonospora curvata (strain ATCC 19995 / DSM 43183 / JCM 3096 / KCTC 9072 / NBRC 15933 / NCIMB 10081 / Henssen B9) TaxID=471852 RepID=D1A6T8_THECD|nr:MULTISPECIES: NAD(P)H-dependent oxidoreductase [Thermomonospora]ACY98342.1 NAD(P)H dehydrogenase (quinone) [Thermomonospora curvata DSM 43183]PKK13507.1 MAG: FMN-dependent NADH-azoreductase [Thermomonospora sp. CIF 1]
MARLLHIDSSPMGDMSVSRGLAAAFRARWEEELPTGTVVYRDVCADPLPLLDRDAIMTFYMPEEARTQAQAEAARYRTALAEELLSADAVLVSAPMHNWTIPAHLKAWLDQVLIDGVTLVQPGETHPLAGRPATVVLAYGGGYTPDAPLAGWDHVEPYLRTVFAGALQMELSVITAQLTLVNEPPELAELARKSRREAEAAIEERARKVAAQLAG